jgi:hypothetical protein
MWYSLSTLTDSMFFSNIAYIHLYMSHLLICNIFYDQLSTKGIKMNFISIYREIKYGL